jgi:predicted AAA+ superfamily ATPase
MLLETFENAFKREVFNQINWDYRFSGLIWERWVWKTTIMLQRLKETWGLYFSLDDAYFIGSEQWTLLNFVHYLYFEKDITMIYMDEIHKYKYWTWELKNIYDSMPTMKVIFSGSSSLDLFKWVLDLVRRVEFYNIYPMNYKEYLKFFHNVEIPEFTLEDILQNHEKIASEYWVKHKEIYFEDFIKKWQYPYMKQYKNFDYINKFKWLIDKVIIEDLPVFINLETVSLDKLRRLLYFIANTTPSELSFTHLAKKIWLHKSIVENALTLLNKIWIVSLVPKFGNLSERVRKEYKMFLWNTCLYNAYNLNTDIWILRECFFVSQVKRINLMEVFTPKEWDFILQLYDKSWQFEIWWKNKSKNKYNKDVYIIKDNIKVSEDKKIIPLWLFWLLKR